MARISKAGWLLLNNIAVSVGGALSWLAMGLFSVNIMSTVRHYGPRG